MTKIELIQSLHDQMEAIDFDESDRIEMTTDLMTLLRDHCSIVGISWYIYTPSFNDGDPCEISFNDHLRVVFDDDEERDEDEEREEFYIPSIPKDFDHLTLDPEITEKIQAAAQKYNELINLLMNTGNLETDTHYTYTWDGDIVTENLEEYYEY